MNWWWQRELADARKEADEAEKETEKAMMWGVEAERVDEHARQVEEGLRRELLRNGFAEALRAAFGSPA